MTSQNSNSDNSIINSLKRLERAGSENSRTTEKLREAAAEVANKIVEMVPLSLIDEEGPKGAVVSLPRGYVIEERTGNNASFRYLTRDGDPLWESRYLDAKENHYQGGDFNCWIGAANRDDILRFSKDIATGLLNEIATWLEERTKANQSATATLKA
jgi:hypothetical protein